MDLLDIKKQLSERMLFSHQEAAKKALLIMFQEADKNNIESVILEFDLQYKMKDSFMDLCEYKLTKDMIEFQGAYGSTSLSITTSMFGDIIDSFSDDHDFLEYISISYRDGDNVEGELVAPLLSINALYLLVSDQTYIKMPLHSPVLLSGGKEGEWLNLNQQVGIPMERTPSVTTEEKNEEPDFDPDLLERITVSSKKTLN